MRAVTLVILSATASLLLDCGKPQKTEPPKTSKVVEDFTGITTIRQGEAIKKKLLETGIIQEQRFKEADEIE